MNLKLGFKQARARAVTSDRLGTRSRVLTYNRPEIPGNSKLVVMEEDRRGSRYFINIIIASISSETLKG